MSMKRIRIAKMALVAILTTFVVYIMIISIRERTIAELALFESIELFVGIPLLTVVYYWLISNKFDEFNQRISRVMRQLEVEEKDLTGEEKTLRQEIHELREVVSRMEKQTSKLKKQFKKKK